MKLNLLIVLLFGMLQTLGAQNLQKLSFTPVKDAPTMIEREKAVVYIRSVVPDIFINSTNPEYTFRKVKDKEGEWILRVNPNEAYMLSVGSKGYLSTVPQRFVLQLREVQVWEVTVGGGAPLEFIPVNFIINPKDATLLIDGEKTDGLTNLQVSIGSHNIEINKPGFATIRQTIKVSPTNSFFNFDLKQVELVGLTLRSEPIGATVFLDGQDLGKAPVSLFKYPGRYEVRYELSDYLTTDEALIIPTDTSKYETSVKLIKNSGFLNLNVTPSDSRISLGRETVKNGRNELIPGNYILNVSKSGWLSAQESITIELGQTLEKSVSLTKNTAVLSWKTYPENSEISINKQDYSSQKQAELAPGTYLVELTAPGYDSYSETIVLERGKPQQKEWKLIQQTGGLRFLSNPSDASAKLIQNGREVLTWTGLKVEKSLPIGNYEILVSMKDYRPKKIPLTIERDKESEIIVKLDEVPALELLEKKGGVAISFKALVFPGWGMSSVSGGVKSGKWFTISSLSLLGAAYWAETQSQSAFASFKTEVDLTKAEDYYTTANQWRQTALTLAGTGVGIWVYNIVRVALIGSANDKLKRQLKEEQKFTMNMSPTLNGLALTIKF